MAAAAADQVAVDLVGHHPEVIFFDDRSNPAQLVLRPHTAGGIVRIAPEYQLARRIGALALEVLVIHFKRAIRLFMQRGSQHIHAGVLRRMEKIAVGRCVEQHLFVRAAKCFRQLVQRGNDARRDAQLLFGKAPVIMILAPFGEGVIVFIVIQAGIAKNAAVDPRAQRVENLGCHAKFHISDPHADKFFVLKSKHLFRAGVKNIAAKTIRVQRIGMAAINNLIKIVGHSDLPFCALAVISGCTAIIANILGNRQPRCERKSTMCAVSHAHSAAK